MSTIFCDEAGNSGANLLDNDQPFFVLASNNFSTDEAKFLLQHVLSPQGAEPKFASLRKSTSGVAKLIRFISDPLLSERRVAASVFHKRFMVTTKMVDLIAETLIHQIGGDLYESGANIAMSNMLHYCMPAFCGEKNTVDFLQSFVKLIRSRDQKHILMFYENGRLMVESSQNKKFKKALFYFTEPRFFQKWFGDHIDSHALDPAIPALFSHIATWGARTEDRFNVVHDASKPILASQAIFESMMALSNEESFSIGYDRRKFQFPLRATSLSQANSKNHPQIQIADLCAGATNHFYKCQISNEFDELSTTMRDLKRIEWVFDGVVPTMAVTPDELGTASSEGNNPVDAIVDYLSRVDT